MPLSWADKYRKAKPAHVVVLDKPFAGVAAGQKLLIPEPALIDDYLRAIPRGATIDLHAMRRDLAAARQADATCPVTTAIHTRIVAEVALEAIADGTPPAAVTPFWRVVDPGSPLAAKLSSGADFIAQQRQIEAAG